MIDHISIVVSDLAASTAFYERVLKPLELFLLVERPATSGFGKRYPEFWLNSRERLLLAPDDSGHHICLRTRSKDAVDLFYAVALANGARCDGAPGDRQGAMTSYYGAFIRDRDGNRIEAVTFPG
jgi:catechol 2,3-dioxygenase-like lactoylglutathione lyase family enzyme